MPLLMIRGGYPGFDFLLSPCGPWHVATMWALDRTLPTGFHRSTQFSSTDADSSNGSLYSMVESMYNLAITMHPQLAIGNGHGLRVTTARFGFSVIRPPPQKKQMTIPISPRPLSPETQLKGKRIFVIPPGGEDSENFTRELSAGLKRVEADPLVLPFTEGDSLRNLDGPVVVWGNLANSDAVRELYFRFLVVTDCRYPGPGGFEIRTLFDPFGNGSNIIHLGYSDETGREAGCRRLLDQLVPVLPHLSEIHATALPIADFQVRQIRAASMPSMDWMITGDNYLTHKGYLAYLTGDGRLFQESTEVWQRIVDYGVPRGDHGIKDLHLRTSMLISAFRLLETAGMIAENLRGRILGFFLEWVYSDQGIERLDQPENTAPGVQRQNHGTIPALALAYLGSYFRDYFPERNEPDEWDVLIERIFSPYADGSWKSASEGICHGWWLEQPVLLEFGLLDRKHRYFRNGGARRAADCAVAVVDNLGWLPSSGDVNLLRAFPGASLRTAAAWYRDPKYTFVYQLAPEFHRLRMHQFLSRTFDMGGGTKIPECGLTVIPLDSIVHEGATKSRGVASWMFETAPTAPVEKCFDKVAFRSGWTPNDAYLLIDGIGGGSHAYADALDIVEYSRLGFTFLVSESGPKFPETDCHSVVSIARDGECQPIPCFAEQEDVSWDAESGTGYARLVLRGNNGGTWTRELFFLGEHGLVIHDHVRAEASGDFAIQCNLRIPGKVTCEEGRAISRRVDRSGDEVIFALQSIVPDPVTVQTVEMDHSIHVREQIGVVDPPYEDNGVEAWARRYGTTDRVVSIIRSRIHTHLKAGEGVSFLHYAHARRPSDPDPAMSIHRGGKLELHGLRGQIPLQTCSKIELSPPSVAIRAEEQDILEMSEVVLTTDGESVKKIVPLVGGGAAILNTSGQIVLCDRDWNIAFELSVKGPIHGADADRDQLYVGHGNAGLSAFAVADGALAWSVEIERIPSSCAWWEWTTPAVLQVVAARSNSGFGGVVVGCGDLHLRSFNAAGECRWAVRYINGIPGAIGLMDVNGDGVDEIIMGGEVMSNCSHARVVNAEGQLIQEVDIEGWTSRMTALALAGGDQQWAAFGTNRGRNFHFFSVGRSSTEMLQKSWVKRLGATTTEIAVDPEKERLLVGNSLGQLLSFDFEGSQRARLAFESVIKRIVATRKGFVVGLEDGWAMLVRDGTEGELQVVGRLASRGDWSVAVCTEAGVFVPTDEGIVKLNVDRTSASKNLRHDEN